jgi:hypothetical protein
MVTLLHGAQHRKDHPLWLNVSEHIEKINLKGVNTPQELADRRPQSPKNLLFKKFADQQRRSLAELTFSTVTASPRQRALKGFHPPYSTRSARPPEDE